MNNRPPMYETRDRLDERFMLPLTTPMKDSLRAKAEGWNTPMAVIVRTAIDAWLVEHDDELGPVWGAASDEAK